MNLYLKKILMNEATSADGGGAGGGAPAAPAPSAAPAAPAPAPTAAAPSPAPAAAPAAPSVLGAGAPAQPWAAPDKYQVKNEDGSVNWEATARKIDEGRSHLEKRMGSGDVPPADVSGYKITVPEAHADVLKDWNPAEDKSLQAFLEKGHKLGMSQAMADLVVGEYGRVMADVAAAGQGPSPEQKAEATAQALREAWKEDGQFEAQVGNAFKAANAVGALAGIPYDEIDRELGNNPTFLKLMAALAPELGEDTSHGTDTPSAGGNEGWKEQVRGLKAEKDALPERDPRRADIQAKINAIYAKNVKG